MQTLGRKVLPLVVVVTGEGSIFSVVSSNQQQQPSLHLVLNPAKENIIVTQTSRYLGSRQQKRILAHRVPNYQPTSSEE